MKKIALYLLVPLIALGAALLIVSCGTTEPTAPTTPTTPTAPAPTLRITKPATGASLTAGNIEVAVQVTNFGLVAPGGAAAAGKGHIHYYLDVTIPTEAGKPAVTAAGTYKASPGATATWENVAAGSHTFSAQLVNNNHTPLSPPVTATVTVTVAAAAAPTPTIPRIPHTLAGRSDCLLCHQTGITQAPKFPTDHAGRTADICLACHQDGLAGAPKRPADHEPAGRVSGTCLTCHETGITGAPKFPADHAGRTSQTCQACHQPG
ncbi:MAG: DUF4399 domain-containing protein [Chloroflexi bacterium]|nr:DUF4399 domain-containing protein [Chloroflexota bacterium]